MASSTTEGPPRTPLLALDLVWAHIALLRRSNAADPRCRVEAVQRTWADSFRHLHPEAEATTYVSSAPWRRSSPRRRLDDVFLQQPAAMHWRVLQAGHLLATGGPHSDHPAVLARVLPD